MAIGTEMMGFALFLLLRVDCADLTLASTQESYDPMTPLEYSKIEKEKKIDNRIRIYEAASTRWMRSVKSVVQLQEFEKLPAALEAWSELLSRSAKDIEKAVDRKKKSRALIRYEIHLRQAVGEMQNLTYTIPVEHEVLIDAWVNRADEVRKQLMDLLFETARAPIMIAEAAQVISLLARRISTRFILGHRDPSMLADPGDLYNSLPALAPGVNQWHASAWKKS